MYIITNVPSIQDISNHINQFLFILSKTADGISGPLKNGNRNLSIAHILTLLKLNLFFFIHWT